MRNRDLFHAHPPPYVKGSPTSFEAALAIEPSVESLRGKVLAFIRSRGDNGATDAEIYVLMRLDGFEGLNSTLCARRVELRDGRLIVDSGRTRTTPAGRQAVVWVAS